MFPISFNHSIIFLCVLQMVPLSLNAFVSSDRNLEADGSDVGLMSLEKKRERKAEQRRYKNQKARVKDKVFLFFKWVVRSTNGQSISYLLQTAVRVVPVYKREIMLELRNQTQNIFSNLSQHWCISTPRQFCTWRLFTSSQWSQLKRQCEYIHIV